MHYLALVLIPENGDVGDLVADVMRPHREVYNVATAEQSGFWDWYQIGGRWTGFLSGFRPSSDPENLETFRGRVQLKWPTEWKRHEGDVQDVTFLSFDHLAEIYTVVDSEGAVHEHEVGFGSKALAKVRQHKGRVVVVDYHN